MSESTAFGKGDSLHQQVVASFPLCDVTEEDLTQNPHFCKLLSALSQRLDHTGLSLSLKSELEKAEQKVQSQRRNWLRSESVYRGLKEMIQEHCVRRHSSTLPPDQTMFYETMERCLLVTQCVQMLDPSSTTNKDQPYLLGLDPQEMLQLMPLEKNVQRMKQGLPKELEKHLKKKCLIILCYCHPEWENESDNLKCTKLSFLATQLDKDKKRAECLKESCQERTVLLQKQTFLYLSELVKCIQLFQTLILDHRLKIQTDVDKKKLDYFEGKCELVLQKIKTEMVDIQLDTYTSDTICAHKKIREKLESELRVCQEEKQSVELKMASFDILGKEFQFLAEEYCRLRQEIEMKHWALNEFTQYNNK